MHWFLKLLSFALVIASFFRPVAAQDRPVTAQEVWKSTRAEFLAKAGAEGADLDARVDALWEGLFGPDAHGIDFHALQYVLCNRIPTEELNAFTARLARQRVPVQGAGVFAAITAKGCPGGAGLDADRLYRMAILANLPRALDRDMTVERLNTPSDAPHKALLDRRDKTFLQKDYLAHLGGSIRNWPEPQVYAGVFGDFHKVFDPNDLEPLRAALIENPDLFYTYGEWVAAGKAAIKRDPLRIEPDGRGVGGDVWKMLALDWYRAAARQGSAEVAMKAIVRVHRTTRDLNWDTWSNPDATYVAKSNPGWFHLALDSLYRGHVPTLGLLDCLEQKTLEEKGVNDPDTDRLEPQTLLVLDALGFEVKQARIDKARVRMDEKGYKFQDLHTVGVFTAASISSDLGYCTPKLD